MKVTNVEQLRWKRNKKRKRTRKEKRKRKRKKKKKEKKKKQDEVNIKQDRFWAIFILKNLVDGC